MTKLTIVIPVYNEVLTIADVVRRVQATPYDTEIIVVDDGSTDGTSEVLEQLRAPNLQIIRQPRNRGKGAALRDGFARATGEYVIVQDADLEYDPRDYGRLLEPLIDGSADVVYGSRFVGTPRRVLYFWHSVANRFLTLMSNVLTNLNLTDMETGYKAFRLEVVRRLALSSNRFGVEPEITAKVARLGCRIYEVPISYRGRTNEEGRKFKWTDGIAAIGAIVRFSVLPSVSSSHVGHDTLSTMDSMRNYNAWLWSRISPHVGRRVLEAGFGTGTISRYLARSQRLIAWDYDEQYVAMLRDRYSDRGTVSVQRVDLSNGDWPSVRDERLDTIICMNVLEHLPDDGVVVERFASILEPGGRLVLLVPAHQALYGTLDQALGHFRRYSRESVQALLGAGGFEVESATLLNPTGVFGWWMNSRILHRHTMPPLQASIYDRLFPILRIPQSLQLPFGLSVLAVGRKPERITSRV